MPPLSRNDELAGYLTRLSDWAVAAVRTMWAQMDPVDVRGSWATIVEPLLAVHERLTGAALDAVDDYMTLTAADAGVAYVTTWHEDFPTRNRQTPSGGDAATYILATPGYILWRIKGGETAEIALVRGLNRLLRLYGTDAHTIARQVTRTRVLADIEAAR